MPFQTIHEPLVSGLDEGTDVVHTAKALMAKNVRFDKLGRMVKRYGVTALPTAVTRMSGAPTAAGTLGTASSLFTRDTELCVVDADKRLMCSYSPTTASFVAKDYVSEATLSRSSIFQGSESAFSGDIAVADGVELVVWQTNEAAATNNDFFLGHLYASARDVTTGAALFTNVKLTTGGLRGGPKIVTGTSSGQTVFLVIYTDALGSMYAQGLGASVPMLGWTSELVLVSDMANFGGSPAQYASAFDAVSTDVTATAFYVAYQNGAPPNGMTLKRFTVDSVYYTGFPVATATATPATHISAVFAIGILAQSNDAVYLAYSDSIDGVHTDYIAAKYDLTSSMTQLVAPTSIYTQPGSTRISNGNIPKAFGMCRVGSNLVVCAQAVGYELRSLTRLASNLSAVGSTVDQLWLSLISRPFTYNGHAYAWCQYVSTLQGTLFLVELNEGLTSASASTLSVRPVATGGPRQVTGQTPNTNCLANVVGLTSKTFRTVASVTVSNQTTTGRVSIVEFTATFADSASAQDVEIQHQSVLTGGCPMLYDGTRTQEIGFSWFPEVNSVTSAPSTGSLGSGVYQYSFCYEYTDAMGVRHRSAPSIPVSVDTTGQTSPTATLLVQNQTLTNRWRDDYGATDTSFVYIVVYRTLVGGTTFYRVTPDEVPSANWCDPRLNSQITITDGASDASIQTNAVLYTTGGVLPAFCPTSSRTIVEHKSRVWLAGTDDGKTLWYSKQIAPGIAPEFNDAQQLTIEAGADITALGSMDDKLVVFKNDRIFVVFGDGPNDLGNGSDYLIQALPADVGCIEPRSVVNVTEGLFFQSARGLEMLTRGLEVVWIGKDVQDELSVNSVVTSALPVPSQRQVRFTCQTPSTPAVGLVLVFDYYAKAWMTHEYNTWQGTADGPAASAMWNGAYAYATTGGTVYTESSTEFTDAGHFTPSAVWLDWKKWANVEGYARTRAVGVTLEQLDTADVTINVYNDYGVSNPYAKTFASSVLGTGVQTIEVRPATQKCEAISVAFFDQAPAVGSITSGQGFAFYGVSYEFMTKGGLTRLPSTRRG